MFLQDLITNVCEVYPELRIRVYVDDVKIHARTKSRKFVAEVPRILLKLKHEVRQVKFDLAMSKMGVEGQSLERILGATAATFLQARRNWNGWCDRVSRYRRKNLFKTDGQESKRKKLEVAHKG